MPPHVTLVGLDCITANHFAEIGASFVTEKHDLLYPVKTHKTSDVVMNYCLLSVIVNNLMHTVHQ